MKATRVITGALVLGSVALGTVGLAPEAAAISLFNPDPNIDDTFTNAPDPVAGKEVLRFWEAEEAVSQSPYHEGNHNHAVWLPNLQGKAPGVNKGTFVWEGDAFLYEYTDDTANLRGSVYALLDPSKKFDVDVWFNTSTVGTKGPKDEVSGSVDDSDWWYYEIDDTKSTLTGVAGSKYDGWSLNLSEHTDEHNTQFGDGGANGKNGNMGLAAWFNYSGIDGQGNSISNTGHADFNLDLIALQAEEISSNSDSVDVPEPATMSLLSLGLVGFGMGALKRKKG